MPNDLYQKRMVQISHMGLPMDQTVAECIASLAHGLDQLKDEIQAMRDLIERATKELS